MKRELLTNSLQSKLMVRLLRVFKRQRWQSTCWLVPLLHPPPPVLTLPPPPPLTCNKQISAGIRPNEMWLMQLWLNDYRSNQPLTVCTNWFSTATPFLENTILLGVLYKIHTCTQPICRLMSSNHVISFMLIYSTRTTQKLFRFI